LIEKLSYPKEDKGKGNASSSSAPPPQSIEPLLGQMLQEMSEAIKILAKQGHFKEVTGSLDIPEFDGKPKEVEAFISSVETAYAANG
jgi:hypothetical protein